MFSRIRQIAIYRCISTSVKYYSRQLTASNTILEHLQTEKGFKYIDSVPFDILRIVRGEAQAIYLMNEKDAAKTAKILLPLIKSAQVIEINPGLSLLTRHLLENVSSNVHVYEVDPRFEETLIKLKKKYPDKFSYKFGDFFRMWKLSYQDKADSGLRLDTFLNNTKIKSKCKDGVIKILGVLTSLNFIRYVMSSVIFQNNLMMFGKYEFFLWMSSVDYNILIGPKDLENKCKVYHKSLPVLFDILFDNNVLLELPRKNFLPWKKFQCSSMMNRQIKEFATQTKDNMYLVHFSVKKKLPCLPSQLPLLWCFYKHNLSALNNRIIPVLEQWIPGCGIWLITGQDPHGINHEYAPSEKDAPLPHITVFTQFADLTSQQKVTLFKRFISWPEFEQSSFHGIVEENIHKGFVHDNSMPKIMADNDYKGEIHDAIE